MADNPSRGPEGMGAYARRVVKFGLVGASGLLVNTGLLALFSGAMGIHYLLGAGLATQGSTAWNFVFTEIWVFRDRIAGRKLLRRFSFFWMLNNGALLIRWPLLWFLTDIAGIQYLVSNLITLLLVMAGRYLLSEFWIWGHKAPTDEELAWR